MKNTLSKWGRKTSNKTIDIHTKATTADGTRRTTDDDDSEFRSRLASTRLSPTLHLTQPSHHQLVPLAIVCFPSSPTCLYFHRRDGIADYHLSLRAQRRRGEESCERRQTEKKYVDAMRKCRGLRGNYEIL